jgi:hypothetical protein
MVQCRRRHGVGAVRDPNGELLRSRHDIRVDLPEHRRRISPLKAAKPKAYQQATAAHAVQISVGSLDSTGEIFTLTYEHT